MRSAFVRTALLTALVAVLPALAQTTDLPGPDAGATPAATTPTDAATPPAEAPGKQPKLVLSQAIVDAGRVPRGNRIEAEFTLVNEGEGDLVIRAVQPACGCTVASFDRRVAPGATGRIHAFVETTNFAGAIAKTLTVISNDPGKPRVELTVKAEIQAHVLAVPSYVRFVATDTVAAEPVGITLYSPDEPAFKVLAATSDLPFVTATVHEATPEERVPAGQGAQWRVEVRLGDEAPIGPLHNFLIVTTSHPQQPKLELPLSGVVRPVLHLTPERAEFGELTLAGQARQIALTLINFGTAAVSVSSVATDVEGITARAEELAAGKRWRIVVALPADLPKGKIEGTLRITTTSSTMPELTVPLSGRID